MTGRSKQVELGWEGQALPQRLEAELMAELIAVPSPGLIEGWKGQKVQLVKQSKERMRSAALALPALDPGKRQRLFEAGEATPETRAKRRSDVCLGLLRRELLDKEHLTAVEEMREIHWAWSKVGYASGMLGMRVDGGKGPGDPLDRIPEHVARTYQLIYLPWLRELVDDPITQRTATMERRFVIAPALVALVVIDNVGLNAAEKRCGVPKDKGLGSIVLRIALERYLDWKANRPRDETAETQAFGNAA